MVEDHVRMGAAMVMTFVVVTFGKGRRGGKHQEEERSGEKLLHATNLARNPGPGEGDKSNFAEERNQEGNRFPAHSRRA